MDLFTPPTAFHFNVAFQGLVPPVPDMAFQEVSGLETDISVEDYQEGGENRFVHKLPKQVSHPNLKLKRALTTMASGLVVWCKMSVEGGFSTPIKPHNIGVSLLNGMRIPVANWAITNAYPVKWTVGDFDAMKNELAVETIELSYQTIQRIT